jgi:hypothetical protein
MRSRRLRNWRRRPSLSDGLRLENCVNDVCPWSGEPVSADSLTFYKGSVVGFCNTGCRDKFEAATRVFDAKIESKR